MNISKTNTLRKIFLFTFFGLLFLSSQANAGNEKDNAESTVYDKQLNTTVTA